MSAPSAVVREALGHFSSQALDRMMTHDDFVFVSDHLLGPIFRGLQYDLMSRIAQSDKSLTMVICDRDLPWCLANANHQKLGCARCLSNVSNIEQSLGSRLKSVRLDSLFLDSDLEMDDVIRQVRDCSSIADVECLEYGGVSLGPGIAAGLAITLRDRPNDIRGHQRLLESIARSTVSSYRSIRNYLADNSQALVVLANGRTPNSWAAHLAARESGQPFAIYEWIPANKGMRLEYNRLVHSVEGFEERGMFFADICRVDDAARRFAEDFFIQNRYNRSAGRSFTNVTSALNVFLADQITGKMPADFSSKKRNIAVFSSSEWEFAGLPGWENSLGASQADILEKLLNENMVSDEFHFWLRIHPALVGSRSQELKRLLGLSHSQLSVIGPSDGIDSYSIMDACEKVVTFGSTVGIEAAYWGKPSILCGRTRYESLGACVRPSTISELADAIMAVPQIPKRALAIPYGLMALEVGVTLENVEFSGGLFPFVEDRALVENRILRFLFFSRRKLIKLHRAIRTRLARSLRRLR